MSETKTYTCHACERSTCTLKDLRYECMCLDRMGLCKSCVNVPMNEWKIPFRPEHNMRFVHDLTPEYTQLFDDIEQKCGKASMISQNGLNLRVTYYEGPNGERDDRLDTYLQQNNLGAYLMYLPDIQKKQYRKEMMFTSPERICTCCTN